MRKQSLIAVVALLIASMTVTLGLGPDRASAQDEALTASVVNGSCDEPGDVAADLRDLAQSEGGVLTSFSRIDFTIDELTGGGYAVTVASGGDTVACGDISGAGNDVYVAVTSRGDAGYGGIAWLHAREDQTQVSLFISPELGGAGAVETPSVPEPPEEDTPTPAAKPTRTPRPSRTPTSAPGEGTTYVSPTYGYTVTYDDTWTVRAEETTQTANGPQDFLQLFNGTSSAFFFTNGAPEGFPCDTVPEVLKGRLEGGTGVTNVEVMTDNNGDPIQGGNSASAYIALTFTWTNQEGKQFELYDYYRCYQLSGKPAVLIFLNEGLALSYDQQGPAREKLENSVTIPE
jgi:hypothetical protein